MTAILQVRGLNKAYGGVQAVKDVSFEVERGELRALIGPNGASKTTCFNLLNGQLSPDSGQVIYRDKSITGLPSRRIWRLGIGRTFQIATPFASMTVLENAQMALISHHGRVRRLWSLAGNLYREDAMALLQRLDLEAAAWQTCGTLAYGDVKRLELAVALAHGPALLLMDEPTAGLDEPSFQRLWERIEELRQRRSLTVLLTTHRPEEAERCDRIAILDRGRIVAEGQPAQLKQQVSGDVLTLRGERIEELAREVTDKLGIEARVAEGEVVIEHDRGHELIPRLVETLGHGRLQSLSMRPPTLADVFLKQTGRSFEEPEEPAHE